jgi:hypothetical protein
VVPAVSGPYDLGNVEVRVALNIDPVTAQVTAISDPLPQIIGGIPLRLRRVLVSLDRPNFVLNPTNCSPLSVGIEAGGNEGARASLRNHFQVANCADLPYDPRLSIRLTGGLGRRGHPAIHAVFQSKAGEANTRRVSVTLPKGELLDNAHIGTVCTRARFAEKTCPEASFLGWARVTTPLLDGPLEGRTYLRSSNHDLPDLAVDLTGQVNFQLVGRVDSVDARLRATFESLPDVPVSSFDLNLAGGRKGLLQNIESLCGEPKHATTRLVGQNGKRLSVPTRLSARCSRGRPKRHRLNAPHRLRRHLAGKGA